ncbi:P-loop containing nucleoside triphosphate hydrolase protein [Metschnikowia bicuspidata var. bicuspidata NRRL YB-4993]|uniref:RNA helicase n=1 Tax=Metschnikowia bicuspidata var. bicuspidata NRRL YB-4993 TaxID=869754 RepID=A0A1A0HK19_9ASCO|nr:P-loop containing nucleoside triphosphate hydrolase protein [Metschnikowia bicuspidata var. bicuspidata NRRL YB-4993]OBA24153.1 P-loop containing nucleoside triphosphate hydrolase protein [Metschnikowia bicuspidata var. bicuspidata NRRL YB-4993]
MGKYRKRFNEKARLGMLAKQAVLKKARNKQFTRPAEDAAEEPAPAAPEPSSDVAADPNAEILQPMTAEEKEERKRRLAETLYSENEREQKMSRAKRKRLDKYIEHQIKREEKKVLLEKLAGTKMDTRLLAPLKRLGQGKLTRREEMIEALELESQGRGDERTRGILYEERHVKDWAADHGAAAADPAAEPAASAEPADAPTRSTFVDFRPQSGGSAGFGFSNLPKVGKAVSTKKYTWRLRVEQEEKKRAKMEDDNDFMLSEAEASDAEHLPHTDSEPLDADELAGSEFGGDESDNDGGDESDNDGGDESENDEKDGSDDNDGGDENDDTDGSDDTDERDVPRLLQNKPKHSTTAESFKQWAEQQVRQLEGHKHMVLPELQQDVRQKYAHGTHQHEVSEDEAAVPTDPGLQRTAFFVSVDRAAAIQQQRMQLPVFSEEHRIMEAVHHHDCIVLCGETGSGKTTQVPQFLYEAGYGNVASPETPGMIGVTQPRRVAAVSMASRVSAELGPTHGCRVGHQIRFDSSIKDEGTADGTALKFMTDGVLLREMMADFLLLKYSALIIDEAHERNVNTDILIGMLSRIVRLRRQRGRPLKLVVMSATLRVADFSENTQLFASPPPVIRVDARQFPVAVHFDKKTRADYMDEAFKKTCKIHRRLPPGGILVFLTGQHEITALVKRLRAEFPFKKASAPVYSETENVKYQASNQVAMEAEDVDLDIALRERRAEEHYSSDLAASDSEEEGFDEPRDAHQSDDDPLYVLPLYSLLPTSQQMAVFDQPPAGSRLCIVATNVAETSLTIPGIRYVVDCGRSKERKFDEDTGVQSFEVDWVSKASADQRAGRAGRTGPGHCYRLFSSAIYEEYFDQFSQPEILRMPVEATVLTMKSMGIDHIVNFPFPTPPDRGSLAKAERLLVTLGALDQAQKHITDLGRTMAHFPLSPRYAKILIVGHQLDCLPYVIAVVSALSVGDPFIDEQEVGIADKPKTDRASDVSEDDLDAGEAQADLENRRKLRARFYKSRAVFSRLDSCSDAFKLLSAVCALDHVPKNKHRAFMADHFLRAKVMEEIHKLRKQIAHIVEANVPLLAAASRPGRQQKLGVPSKEQISAMKQIIASGFVDQVAIRSDVLDADIKLSKRAGIISVPYSTIYPVALYGSDVEPHVYIHPGSIIGSSGATPPQYLVYQSLNRGLNQREGRLAKLRMKPLVDLSGRQLTNIAKSSLLVTYSKPLGHPYAPKTISATKRECYVVPRYGAALGDGGLGWDLPVIKVIQVKKHGLWEVEES